MTNLINFPSDNFENLTLTERAIIIEEWTAEMNENLEQIRRSSEAMKALLDAHKANSR